MGTGEGVFSFCFLLINIKAITLYSLTHNVKEKRVGLPSSGHSKVSQKSYLHFIPITLCLDFVKPLLSFNFSILSKLKKTITLLSFFKRLRLLRRTTRKNIMCYPKYVSLAEGIIFILYLLT